MTSSPVLVALSAAREPGINHRTEFRAAIRECRCESNRIGCHWPAVAGVGAGDGNRKYRWGDGNHRESESYELVRALRALI